MGARPQPPAGSSRGRRFVRRPGRARGCDDARPVVLGRRVRTPEGGIEEVVRDVSSPMKRHRLWRLPVIRGVIALGESLAIGFRALAISANVAAREEDDEGNVVTEISRGQIIFSFAIAIGFALMLFKIGPGAPHELAAHRRHDVVRHRRRADPGGASSSPTSG